MRLRVEHEAGVLLDIDGELALAPTDGRERQLVFQALADALALLANITPPASPVAMGAGSDERPASTERCHSGRTSGVVVRLEERRGSPTGGSREQ